MSGCIAFSFSGAGRLLAVAVDGRVAPLTSASSRVEGRRACCRWRVSSSALSIAEWVHNSTVATFPAPATSNAACGFPALRFPARFTSRVMGPSMWPLLSSPFYHFIAFSGLYPLCIDTIRPLSLIPGARRASSDPPDAVVAHVPGWPSWPRPSPACGPVTLPTAHCPARHVCWWLRQAWDSLAPNDLLYVSAATAPSTQSYMRPEALGEARAWAAPSIKRFARRTRPINEPSIPTRLLPVVAIGHVPSSLLLGRGSGIDS